MAPGFSCSDYINASYVDVRSHTHTHTLTDITPTHRVTSEGTSIS